MHLCLIQINGKRLDSKQEAQCCNDRNDKYIAPSLLKKKEEKKKHHIYKNDQF